MKKLLITSTDLMMLQFLIPHVRYLHENGFRVEVACSPVGGRMAEVCSALADCTDAIHRIRLERSPASFRNLMGYRDLRRLLRENRYDLIWTNEPVMGVVTRLSAWNARKRGTKVVYMCHGFHFFKGASIFNWLLFYPTEKCLSRMCDGIITMNREDYCRASTFHCPRVFQIPGVGLDISRFSPGVSSPDRSALRQELGIPGDAYLLLSVGELTRRKNHQVVLRALSRLNNPGIHYVICGVGNQRHRLERLAEKLGLQTQIHFPGYRRDIASVLQCADCFVFPSLQEGLPFALMEAMHCGLPIIGSRIRGNVDLIDEPQGGILCDPRDAEAFSHALRSLPAGDLTTMAAYNREKLSAFRLEHTRILLHDLFLSILA